MTYPGDRTVALVGSSRASCTAGAGIAVATLIARVDRQAAEPTIRAARVCRIGDSPVGPSDRMQGEWEVLTIRLSSTDNGQGVAVAEHPNVELTQRGYEAFAKGDFAELSNIFADDIVWHSPGPGPLSGTYRGRDEVFGLFGRLVEESGGTFKLEVHDVLANDDHAVALTTTSMSRGGKSIQTNDANVFHIKDGKVTEFWLATTDPEAAVDFWS